MNTERIIEVVARLFYYRMRRDFVEEHYTLHFDLFRKWLTAIVNLAMSGVCPECGGLERVHTGMVGGYPYRSKPCKAEFHDHREALEAALAAPSDALLAEREDDAE